MVIRVRKVTRGGRSLCFCSLVLLATDSRDSHFVDLSFSDFSMWACTESIVWARDIECGEPSETYFPAKKWEMMPTCKGKKLHLIFYF